MNELSEFLLARIAEDEAELRDRELHFGLDKATARGLAECAGLRGLIEYCSPEPERPEGELEQAVAKIGQQVADGVLPFIAVRYRDHPDYREEWRP